MNILDDAVLALIARFVVDDIDHLGVSEEQFLRRQCQEVQQAIRDVPPEQRQQAVLNWISDHAEQYRNNWRRQALSRALLSRRCSDCPLINEDSQSVCVIHQQWAALLNDYVAGNIQSAEYIESSLELLQQHKNHLKVSRIKSRL
ncbi:MAG: hypothetical protein EP315_01480 [Gammaproteobacteria bacterium]|nr:MAG: hypothetical protein EP315_01480 [Gammaproteobacteria bacterium]